MMRAFKFRLGFLLIGAHLASASSAAAGSLADLFESIAIADIVVASPATLERTAVDPTNFALAPPGAPHAAVSIPTGGTTIDTGFFTGLVQSNSVLSEFANDSLTQVQNLPVSSSVAAFTFSFQPATNTWKNDEVGFGPILADRAQTIGRGMVNFGVSYQRVNFQTFEGKKLSKLQLDADIQNGRVYTSSPNGINDFNGSFLTILLDDASGTIPTDTPFGISFPPAGIRNQANLVQAPDTSCGLVEVATNPTLTPNPANANGCFFPIDGLTRGRFETPAGSGLFVDEVNAQGIVPDGPAFLTISSPSIEVDMELDVDVLNVAATVGILDNLDVGFILPVLTIDAEAEVSIESFDNGCPPLDDACNRMFAQDVANGVIPFEMASSTSRFSAQEYAFGIGDLALRAKYQPLESKWIDAAIRGTLFLPTGRESDFLGTGEVSGEITLIASKTYFKRVAAHANFGVFLSSGPGSADQLRYRAGVSALVHPRFNIGADIVGSHDLNPNGIGDDIISIGPGLKWNPWDRIVVTAAAIVKLNNEGLRSPVIPAISIEYTLD